MELLLPGVTEDVGYMMVVTSVLTPADLDLFSTLSRIAAGVRVVDSSTGKSVLLSQVQGTPHLRAFSSDLATLYCGCSSDGGGVDPACVKAAYDTYDNCVRVANATALVLELAAVAALTACMVYCAGGGLFGPVGWLMGSACGVNCYIYIAFYIASASIAAVLAIQLGGCRAQLKIDLAACGVGVYETN
jgi:hypothetical protein